MPLDDTVRTLIDGPHAAVLATANAAGRPHSTVIIDDNEAHNQQFKTNEARL
ncbi:pyridoxamine 5'-phosphate oxidase family protein [Nocardia abscessus]|uniref:pyridoxamine 5'-phosphate oxidase family protein n=1 Tax=Nocardia abscessus TaxID=120957 RepID=UPI0024565FF6|nr:pyridoxamine 5'-phosphate oxidase family protein [Nocardia abscessus]